MRTLLPPGGCGRLGGRISSVRSDGPVVAHLVFPYLFRTGSWIHGQLVHMRRHRPIVVTDQTENLDLFPFEPIYAYQRVSAVQKALLCVWRGRFHGALEPFVEWVVRRTRARLLQSHFGTTGAEMLEIKGRTRLPMVTTFYGADVSEAPRYADWRRRFHFLFQEGELFLVEGNAMRQALLDLGCPPEKAVVQRLGVDLESLPFVVRRPDAAGIVRILIAATFREKKGIPAALCAVDRVRRRYPDLVVTLMGDVGGKPGDAEEKRAIIALLGRLEGVVRWVGFAPYRRYREALLTHHLFLSPSVTAMNGDSEGGAPVTLIEAQATGMPVVSTFHADIPEVVVHGRTGFLSPEGDVDSLAENLERLVLEPDRWEAMGTAGRVHVEVNHDVRAQVARLEELYAGLIRAV